MAGGKILVVDDSLDWRSMIGGLLSDAGYQVQVAEDEDIAMRLLRKHTCHIAVVDLRLDERDERNRAGLALAGRMKEYAPELAIIILTAYADVQSVKAALEPQPDGGAIAFDFLEKFEIAKLLPKVQMAFEKGAKVNPKLQITLSPALSWGQLRDGIECLQPLDIDEAESEITDLLQRLFHEAQQIMIKPLNNGHSSGSVVLVSATSENIPQADVVTKFDERSKAKQEATNYDRFVARYIGGARRTQRLDFRSTARLGGIAYSFVGGEPSQFRRFGDVYRTSSISNLKGVLDNLFLETCHTWYAGPMLTNNNKQALGACYREWLSLNNTKLRMALWELIGSNDIAEIKLTLPSQPYQSSLEFVGRLGKVPSPLSLSNAAFSYEGPFCFTHGDLHENNILVDDHSQTWLLDFYQTGPAHPARDFALLECAIKFYLQASDRPLVTLFDWEHSLLGVSDLTKTSITDRSPDLDQELVKASEVVFHIRNLLARLVPAITYRDYLISLYFHALKGMTLSRKFSQRQRLHAVASTSLLADALK